MNNCPKCGNPLQAGVNSCPICGTNIDVNNKPNTVAVTSVSKPAENQVQVEQTEQKVETVEKSAPVVQQVAPENTQAVTVEENKTQVQSNNVENQSVQSKVEEQPKSEPVQNTANVAPQETNQVKEEPVVAQPVVPANIQPTPVIQPTVTVQQPVANNQVQAAPVQNQPVTNIPLSLEINDPAAMQVAKTLSAELQPEVKPAPKKKANKNVILIAAVLVIMLVAGGLYFMQNSTSKMKNPGPQQPQKELAATTSVSSNGYKFNLPEGWLINEDGRNVILTNTNETVAIKFDHSTSNLSNISKDMIENYLSNSPYEKTEVNELQISAKDAYVINANINELPVQIYFIGGGSNLIIGVTIVYQSEDTKAKYEPTVTELLGTLSFSDESIKAISTLDTYSDIFNIYGGIINSQKSSNNVETSSREEEIPTPEVEKENNEENNSTPTE